MNSQDNPETEVTDLLPDEGGNFIVPAPVVKRLFYAIVTIVLPIISFAINDILSRYWQNGNLGTYVGLMISPDVASYFYVFLLCSMISMVLLLISPERFAEYHLVRFGIYTGVVLSLQYLVLLFLSNFNNFVFISNLFYLALIIIYSRLIPKFNQWIDDNRKWIYPALGVSISIWIFVLVIKGVIFVIPFIFVVGLFTSGPLACLLIFAQTAFRLMKKYRISQESRGALGISMLIWGGGYVAVWQLAITRTLKLYSELPTYDPSCYIATAAAKGHPNIVGSSRIEMKNGQYLWVNPQLRNLKCAELTLMTISPQVHNICRNIYDVLGKWLAAKITHPLIADLVYVSLKPFEWGSSWLLKIFVRNYDVLSEKIYSQE